MIKKSGVFSLFLIVFALFSSAVSAQVKQGQLVDGIAAVIGNEIILESDIDEQMAYTKQQRINVPTNANFSVV